MILDKLKNLLVGRLTFLQQITLKAVAMSKQLRRSVGENIEVQVITAGKSIVGDSLGLTVADAAGIKERVITMARIKAIAFFMGILRSFLFLILIICAEGSIRCPCRRSGWQRIGTSGRKKILFRYSAVSHYLYWYRYCILVSICLESLE